ncbi:MAG: sulfite exporter TauE/SafE family protein [Ktedonobacteraceae bacterium]
MTFLQGLLLFVAAVFGGTLNAVAGGGSFFTFPALIFTGVGSITANATSTVALWPGSIASVGAYRRDLVGQQRGFLLLLLGTSLIGGVLGAILLLRTPESTFVNLIPYLLLGATLLFALSPYITARLRVRTVEKTTRISTVTLIVIAFVQFVIAIYGGYFGGGIGILMLAALAFMGMDNINKMNAVKTLLTLAINGAGVVTFVIAGRILWLQALVMIVGAIVGGYGGAYYARKIEQRWIRLFVIVTGVVLTIYFFVHH